MLGKKRSGQRPPPQNSPTNRQWWAHNQRKQTKWSSLLVKSLRLHKMITEKTAKNKGQTTSKTPQTLISVAKTTLLKTRFCSMNNNLYQTSHPAEKERLNGQEPKRTGNHQKKVTMNSNGNWESTKKSEISSVYKQKTPLKTRGMK